MAGVRTQHKDYAAMVETWQKMRDCEKGQKAVHAAGVKYLPKLKDQETDDYNAYKLRATFFNAFFRTIAGLRGMMFRVEPQIEAPATLQELFSDITAGGVNLNTFSQMCADEALTVSRLGILADHPQAPPDATKADAKRLNLRPTLALYPAESIINWRTGQVNNQTVLTLVVLAETHEEHNEFETETETRYRVLDLTATGYRQRVYRVDDKGTDIQIGGDIFPTMNGQPMTEIPFIFIGPNDTTPTVYEPVLCDLADLNLSHYQVYADHRNCLHKLAPTAVITGHTPEEGQRLYIGADWAWCIPSPDAKAYFLEFEGKGLGESRQELADIENRMAIMGARMLEAPKRAAEAAETAAIHRQGEQSVLAAMATTLSLGMTKALEYLAGWLSATGEVSFAINTDFLPAGISPQAMAAIQGLYTNELMSKQAVFDNLKRGQLYPADATFEDEDARIREGGPIGGLGGHNVNGQISDI